MNSNKLQKLAFAAVAALALSLTGGPRASAQDFALSTNAVDYLNFGTLNAEMSYSLTRHWTATASFRYNPFLFGEEGSEVTNRQRTFSAGTRYWPWHVYSGWWFGGKLQWQEFNRGGITSRKSREGFRAGTGASLGYTYMLGKHFNLDFGVGLWTGYEDYTVYQCPVCGLTVEKGKKFFLLPNDLVAALSYIF